MNRDDVLADLVKLTEELCDRHQHIEPVYDSDGHRNRRLTRVFASWQDSLMQQLTDLASGAVVRPDEITSGGAGFGSRPPGNFEATAARIFIATSVSRWCWELRVPQGFTVEGSIRALVKNAENVDDDVLGQLSTEVRYWHGQASTLTGWNIVPVTYRVPCPLCGAKTGIRINLTKQSAYCTSVATGVDGELVCGASWAEGTVTERSPLVAYIRRATAGGEDREEVAA